MRKLVASFIFVVILVLAILLPGCDRVGSSLNGSGRIIDQPVNVSNFTGVDVQGAFSLEIGQSDAFNVTVSTDDNLINRVLLSHDGDNLKIRIQAPATFFPTSLKIKIGMPRIYDLNLSGGAKANISSFQSTFNFNLTLTQASFLGGHLEAGNSEFDISGGSQMILQGSALSLDLNVSGGSKLDLENFALNSAHLNFKESSEAIINVNGILDAKLATSSTVYYVGNPVFSDTSITGGSTMKHK